MTYIVVSENEIVKAEMERPKKKDYSFDNLLYTQHLEAWYKRHITSLPRIPAPGHKWKLWDEVVEGKDFEFMVKGYSMGNEMLVPLDFAQGYIQDVEDGNILDSVSAKVLRKHLPDRIVAIPIQPTPEGKKPDCSQHKRELFGQTDMKVVAEAIGDLHYETLKDLLYELTVKLSNDSAKYLKKGRKKLALVLFGAARKISESRNSILEALRISKPFMDNNNPQTK